MTTKPLAPELSEHHTALAAVCRLVGVTASALAVGWIGAESPGTATWISITAGLLLLIPAVLLLRRRPDPLDGWLAARVLPWSAVYCGFCLGLLLQTVSAPPRAQLFYSMVQLFTSVAAGAMLALWLPSHHKTKLWVQVNGIASGLAQIGHVLAIWLLPGLASGEMLWVAVACLVLMMGVIPALLMLQLGIALPLKLDDLPGQIARLRAPDWLPVRLCILVVAVLITWLSWWLNTLPAIR